MAADDALLAAAAEAVFGSADLCAVVLLGYSPKSHLRAARLVLTTSMVCRSWRLSVNSARVWAALCHQRWPSTGTLPLPPMVDYCRYFQSRALAQAEIDRKRDIGLCLGCEGPSIAGSYSVRVVWRVTPHHLSLTITGRAAPHHRGRRLLPARDQRLQDRRRRPLEGPLPGTGHAGCAGAGVLLAGP